ncbi:ABC transporter ATP-binding protein [Cryobacterium sp. N21]|uniref:ABC transporter ATP-binding protein n=1 Tax=Cryobacterium sp. N21 TaxID=2048289 RepID=UPI0018EB5BCA|nr:ABC transporter ATP-binding protein [Cryobacterium sp. N21]
MNLSKRYDGDSGALSKKGDAPPFAIRGVDLEVEEGDFFTLLGPSGCGKSTTLRSIAGLETPTSGAISLAGSALFEGQEGHLPRVNVPVNRRALGMVFQSYAIWPHMSVFDNVAFPLQVMARAVRPSKAEITRRVDRMLETMELSRFADRPATMLSGGQQQRLALGRAIVTEPDLLLLDEPLSNLDAKLRESLRFELRRLQRELGITTVYVTHDQAEALALSSKIAVMSEGKVEQIGTPREIYTEPASKFVANFIGTANFIEGRVLSVANGFVILETCHGQLEINTSADIAVGSAAIASLRPESLEITPRGHISGKNFLDGVIVGRAYQGDSIDYIIRVGDDELKARTSTEASFARGEDVSVFLAESKAKLVPVA